MSQRPIWSAWGQLAARVVEVASASTAAALGQAYDRPHLREGLALAALEFAEAATACRDAHAEPPGDEEWARMWISGEMAGEQEGQRLELRTCPCGRTVARVVERRSKSRR